MPSVGGLFFNLHPAVTLPVLDGGFVSFQSAPFWFLTAPSEVGQNTADVRGVVLHTEFALDDRGDTPGSPQIVTIPVGLRADGEKCRQTLPLSGRELSWTSRRRS